MTQLVGFKNQFNQFNANFRDGYSSGIVVNLFLNVTAFDQ